MPVTQPNLLAITCSSYNKKYTHMDQYAGSRVQEGCATNDDTHLQKDRKEPGQQNHEEQAVPELGPRLQIYSPVTTAG